MFELTLCLVALTDVYSPSYIYVGDKESGEFSRWCHLAIFFFSFCGLLQITLFTGEVNSTAAFTVSVRLNPSLKLLGGMKVKIYSHPPGRCIKATLWVCYDQVTDNKPSRSEYSKEGDIHNHISKESNTVDKNLRPDTPKGGPGLIINPLTSRSTMQRIRRAAASLSGNNPASWSTTPRTCKS